VTLRHGCSIPFGYEACRVRIWVPHPWFGRVRVLTLQRNPLKRHYGRGDLHFVTFSCYRRRPLLSKAHARDCFVKTLDLVRSQNKFLLLGYVVMREHVHLLVSEPVEKNLSKSLQVLKQRVSRTLLKKRRKVASTQLILGFAFTEQEKHFWQRRFYDFNVWSEAKFKEKLNYMHANPVKKGLVLHAKDWPWSSWSYYANGTKGLIRIDSLEAKSQVEGKA
jgi:putative transposase